MKRFALIGRHLQHSYSQRWFEELFARLGLEDHSYELKEMPTLDGLREWVQTEHISGFNVTVPYKQEILPHLDAMDKTATAIGAVNCVTVERVSKLQSDQVSESLSHSAIRLVGHNTDAPAFRDTLSSFITHHSSLITQSYILGTGGAARAVAYALGQLGIPYTFVSRHPEKWAVASNQWSVIGYNQLFTSHLSPFTLIVNATPVGMYPAVDKTPLDITHAFKHSRIHAFVYDLIYNPSPTLLMREAAACGAQVKDGLEMLHCQAELSWELFRSTTNFS